MRFTLLEILGATDGGQIGGTFVGNAFETFYTDSREVVEGGVFFALKGAETFIATPYGEVFHYSEGDVGLATSGSGDILSGILVGLLARGATLDQAAVWAVYLHGAAGNRLKRRIGPVGFLARELSGEVPALISSLASRR